VKTIGKAVLAFSAAIALVPLAQGQGQPVGGPPIVPTANDPVTAAEARETAAEFARMVEENYVDPAKAQRYAAAVRAAAGRGDYDRAGTVAALARMLTRDVLAVAPEGHLRVLPLGAERGPGPRMVMRRMGGPEESVAPLEPGPGKSIEVAKWLAPGIAYIRFDLFAGEPASMAAVAKFMRDHGDAETVIFDLRTTRGGTAGEVEKVLSYLFAQETVAMRADMREAAFRRLGIGTPPNRRVVASPAGIVTWDHVVTPDPSERRLFDAKVLVLTSQATGSAAEHFALALKGTGRATLIGEVTGGAGNFAFGGPQPLGRKFTAFVPIGRTYEPRTGIGWEGTGVEPNISVPAQRALVEALTRSGVAAADAERLSASVQPTNPMQRPRPPV
jgi:hypothetical protein